jgi:hypothetical protein
MRGEEIFPPSGAIPKGSNADRFADFDLLEVSRITRGKLELRQERELLNETDEVLFDARDAVDR